MKSMTLMVLGAVLALGVAAFALAGTASAASVAVELMVPGQATTGEATEIHATLRGVDNGRPVTGAMVTLYTDASIVGVAGEVEIGHAVTDENGIAAVRYEPRQAGDHEIRVEYVVPGGTEPEVVTKSITIVGGDSQLYRSSAGVNIPGLNVWLIMAVLAGVWLTLLSVAVRVIAIANDGGGSEVAYGSPTRRGFAGD